MASRAIVCLILTAHAALLASSARLAVSSAKRSSAAAATAPSSLSVHVTHSDAQHVDESSVRSTLAVAGTDAANVMQYEAARGEKCCKITTGRLYWHERVWGAYAPADFDVGGGQHLCKQHAYFNKQCQVKTYSLLSPGDDHPRKASNAGILQVSLDMKSVDTVDDADCSHGSISFCNDLDHWWPFVVHRSAGASALQIGSTQDTSPGSERSSVRSTLEGNATDAVDVVQIEGARGEKCCKITTGRLHWHKRVENKFNGWGQYVGTDTPAAFDVGAGQHLCKQHVYFNKECQAKTYSLRDALDDWWPYYPKWAFHAGIQEVSLSIEAVETVDGTRCSQGSASLYFCKDLERWRQFVDQDSASKATHKI